MVLRDDIGKKRFILSSPINALKIGDIITSSHPLVTQDVLSDFGIQTVSINAEKSYFGFKIPYIPVQIKSTELLAINDIDKLIEILNQYTNFVRNLSKWVGSSFSIRYIFDPTNQNVKIAFLGRVMAKPGQSIILAEEIAHNVEGYLANVIGIPIERIDSKVELSSLLEPYNDLKFCEIWQREQTVNVTERNDIGEEIYHPVNIICPFDRPKNATWLGVFKRIVIEEDPIVINIHIEPTQLFDFEEYKLQEAQKIINGFVNYKIIRNTYTKEVEDPINKAIAKNYYRRWQQLTGPDNPILEIIQVGCKNPFSAYEIAQVFSQEITNSIHFEETISDENLLPSGYEIVPCLNNDENQAKITFTDLDILPREFTKIEHRGRSRYLTNVVSASAAFRFPVSIRTGIAGIQTKIPVEGMNVHSGNQVLSSSTVPLGNMLGSQPKIIGLPLDYFSKHLLVAGNTGSGKTHTCLQIVGELWKKNIPFLIIEPVNPQYRTLIKDNDPTISNNIQVFTLGNESVSPFRLNPFELLPGIRVEEHLSQIATCFQAAFPQFPVLPTIIQDSLYNIYASKGWQLSDTVHQEEVRQFPTLGDFYIECVIVAENGGWSKEITQNIVGAVSVRLGGLLRGSKGLMLNTAKSFPMKELMEKPTILELNSLNNEERSLMMMFLLVFIREFAQTRNMQDGKPSHITVIEEAHRVMSSKTQSSNIEIASDISGSSVKTFSEIISEVRWLGEGIVIAEQIPSRLIEDAHKNTNSKIVHRLSGEDDRVLISNTMNANDKQIEDISHLENGQAAFFTSNMDSPTFIQVNNYPLEHNLPRRLSDQEVHDHMISMQENNRNYLLPFLGCAYCESICKFREQVMMKAYQINIAKVIKKLKENNCTGEKDSLSFLEILKEIKKVLLPFRLDKDFNAVYCFFIHIVDFEITDSIRNRLLWEYELLLKER